MKQTTKANLSVVLAVLAVFWLFLALLAGMMRPSGLFKVDDLLNGLVGAAFFSWPIFFWHLGFRKRNELENVQKRMFFSIGFVTFFTFAFLVVVIPNMS